ncbi:MAG: acyltransferase family protein [Thermoleophilaceae bacterium]
MNVRNPRFPLFDSLRAIAALSVVAFHAAYYQGFLAPGHSLSRYYAQLNVGVAIFFVISGFLLYRPFAQARFSRGEFPGVFPYAVRRVARIVPAYWLALPIIAAWLGRDAVFTAHGIPIYFGFLQVYSTDNLFGGIGQAWSICVEVSFYAVLPLWALAMRRIRFRDERGFLATELTALAALFAAGVLWKVTTMPLNAGGTAVAFSPKVVTLPYFLDLFAIGMSIAAVSVALGFERGPARASWVPWVVAFGAFVLLCNVSRWFGVKEAEIVRHELKGVVGAGLILPAVFGTQTQGVVRKVLAAPALLWIGLVSYGVYLWQPAIMDELVRHNANDTLGPVLAGLASLALALVVAAISYYGMERYALRLARRVGRRPVVEKVVAPVGD